MVQQLFGIGDNSEGVLGLGPTTKNDFNPTPIFHTNEPKKRRNQTNQESPSSKEENGEGVVKRKRPTIRRIRKVYAGSTHSFVIADNNKLYTFGKNLWGECASPTSPQYNPQLLAFPHPIKHIACGDHFTFLVTRDNRIFCWGFNHYGQLGLGTKSNQPNPIHNNHIAFLTSDTKEPRKVTQIVCGANHTCIVMDNCDMFSFGSNQYGQLGVNSNSKDILEPRHLLSFSNDDTDEHKYFIDQLVCGRYHNVVLTQSNEVWVYGHNQYGQLGLGHYEDVKFPQRLKLPTTSEVIQVSAGDYHTAILTSDSKVFICGQLLDRKVHSLTEMNTFNYDIFSVACGANFTYVVADSSRRLLCMGINNHGQLGVEPKDTASDDNPHYIEQFQEMNLKPSGLAISNLSCGSNFVIYSTFTAEYRVKRMDDLKNQLYKQNRVSTGFLFDFRSILQGTEFKLCRELLQTRYPPVLKIGKAQSSTENPTPGANLSAGSYQLLIDYLYTDEIHHSIEKEETNSVHLLELYLYLGAEPEHQSTRKLEALLLDELVNRVSERNVISILKKFDLYKKYEDPRGRLSTFKQHVQAFIKQIMDGNRLDQVPDFKLLDMSTLHDILLRGGQYKLIPKKDPKVSSESHESLSTYYSDMVSLKSSNLSGNVKFHLDAEGQHTVRAHKSIVAARCPKLRDIMEEHFRKNSDHAVHIHNLLQDDEMIKLMPEFFHFLYTGEFTITQTNAITLTRIWDIFNMPTRHIVYDRCQSMAVNTLDVSNVLPLFQSLQEEYIANLQRDSTNTTVSTRRSTSNSTLLQKECRKLCLENWKELHETYGASMLQYLHPEVYFSINAKFLNVSIE